MLLMTAAASAETASTFTFLDPVKIRLSILGDGERLTDITAQVSRVDEDQVHRL